MPKSRFKFEFTTIFASEVYLRETNVRLGYVGPCHDGWEFWLEDAHTTHGPYRTRREAAEALYTSTREAAAEALEARIAGAKP